MAGFSALVKRSRRVAVEYLDERAPSSQRVEVIRLVRAHPAARDRSLARLALYRPHGDALLHQHREHRKALEGPAGGGQARRTRTGDKTPVENRLRNPGSGGRDAQVGVGGLLRGVATLWAQTKAVGRLAPPPSPEENRANVILKEGLADKNPDVRKQAVAALGADRSARTVGFSRLPPRYPTKMFMCGYPPSPASWILKTKARRTCSTRR